MSNRTLGLDLDGAIRFTVFGTAVPQARPRAFRTGNGVRTYTPDKCTSWKNIIAYEAQRHVPPALLDCPLAIKATFFIFRPKSRRGKKDLYPDTKPDFDNLVKAVTDACEGLIYTNDSRIVSAVVEKQWGDPPRVEIEIRRME